MIWDSAGPSEAVALEPGCFALPQRRISPLSKSPSPPFEAGLAVVMVDPVPRLEHFAPANRARIVDALVALLTAERASTRGCARACRHDPGLRRPCRWRDRARLLPACRTAAFPFACSTSPAFPKTTASPGGGRIAGLEGWIAAADWRLDLDDISGVYARFLGPDDRPPLPGLDPPTRRRSGARATSA